jgi:hypothetical protein
MVYDDDLYKDLQRNNNINNKTITRDIYNYEENMIHVEFKIDE